MFGTVFLSMTGVQNYIQQQAFVK